MDGKDSRGASRQTENGRRMTAAAVEHGTGTALRQIEVDAKSNGIPAVRDLADSVVNCGGRPYSACYRACL